MERADRAVVLALSAWSECCKILIPLGGIERPLKLHYKDPLNTGRAQALPATSVVCRFSGHQNFTTVNLDAYPNLRRAEGGNAKLPPSASITGLRAN